MADLQREAVRPFVKLPAGQNKTATQARAGRDEKQATEVLVADRVFADGRRVAIVRHVHRDAEAFLEFPADVRAHPVIAKVRLAPDHSARRGRRHIQPDPAHLCHRDPRVSAKLRDRQVELAEGGLVTVFHQALHLHDRPHLLPVGTDDDRLHRGAADIQPDEIFGF